MKTITTSLRIFFLLTLLTGVFYPLVVTGIAQLVFPNHANGSLLTQNGKVIGSKWIGQPFDRAIYFRSRPSAVDYQTMPSGGSNLGLTSVKLKKQVEQRTLDFLRSNQLGANVIVPADMLFASASGLDPHISPESALLQVDRIAEARKLTASKKQQLRQLITQQTESPQLFCLGESRVNVLVLNALLDRAFR